MARRALTLLPLFPLILALAPAPAAGLPPLPPVAFVDFSRPLAGVPARAFGVNSYQAFSEALPNKTGYVANVAAMLGGGAGGRVLGGRALGGFARLHREDMMMSDAAVDRSSWLDFNGGGPGVPAWNFTRVDAALDGLVWRGAGTGVPVMLCFSGFPRAWANASNGNRSMSEAFEGAWAGLAARLVAHLRDTLSGELPPPLLWVELTNEWDSVGYPPSSLGRLVVAAAAAVRSAWPGVRVGGPAWARPDLTDAVEGFLAVAGPSIDFVTYHAYCNGDKSAPLGSVFACAGDPFVTRWMTDNLPRFAAGGNASALLAFHDEMNISWNPPDVRMTNGVGAAFDALWALSSVLAGAAGVSRWNEADGWYGALGNDAAWTPRPPAFVWAELNVAYARGGAALVAAGTDAPSNITAFASFVASGPAASTAIDYTVVVINTSGDVLAVSLEVTAWAGAGSPPTPAGTAVRSALVSDAGLALSAATLADLLDPRGVALPPNAVAFWSFSA